MFQKFKKFSKLWIRVSVCLFLIGCSHATVQRSGKPTLVELRLLHNSINCRHIARVLERHYDIPEGLLQSIGKVESKLTPWVVCANGKSHYFSNEKDMNAYIHDLSAITKNFYIGCMQISYHHHKRRLNPINRMIQPFFNIEYAAKMLVRFHKKHGSWEKAVQCYHSGVFPSNIAYQKRIFSAWKSYKPLSQVPSVSCSSYESSVLHKPSVIKSKKWEAERAVLDMIQKLYSYVVDLF